MTHFTHSIYFLHDIHVFYINLIGYLGYYTYLFRYELHNNGQKSKLAFRLSLNYEYDFSSLMFVRRET